MAREFKIIDGPSKQEVELATFDPVPREGLGAHGFHRELRFHVLNESGHRVPLYQLEFGVRVRGVKRAGDLGKQTQEYDIEGSGSFNPPSPFWIPAKAGAPPPEFRITYNVQTRKGKAELVEGKGWEDTAIEGTVTIQVYVSFSNRGVIEMRLSSSSEELGERVEVALISVLREENFPSNRVPLRLGSGSVGVRIGIYHVEQTEEVLGILESLLQGHQYLQGIQAEVQWSDDARKLVQEAKGETV